MYKDTQKIDNPNDNAHIFYFFNLSVFLLSKCFHTFAPMKTTGELFLELMQVSMGLLDCLSRGPEPEEWQELYELSKRHKVEGITYVGVERLFEYGLRAPQDISIDWMSEAELIRESNAAAADKLSALTANYPEELRGLRQSDDDDLGLTDMLTIQTVFKIYQHGRLNMRVLMDYYYTLLNHGYIHESIHDNAADFMLMGWMGIRRFTRGTMWFMHHAFGLKRQSMLCDPMEQEGHYLLKELMEGHSWVQHIVHRVAFIE